MLKSTFLAIAVSRWQADPSMRNVRFLRLLRELADSNIPFIHHGDTEGTEKILEFLWDSSVISVLAW
jgi:ABC-type tungstate transport system permease subunit